MEEDSKRSREGEKVMALQVRRGVQVSITTGSHLKTEHYYNDYWTSAFLDGDIN